jgi:selenocysteine lyase/cysteine desulfurase
MLDPRLTYLNTASLAPAPARIFDATVAAWRELETNPVRMGYGRDPDTTISAADRVRGKAAKLLGCDADEVLITTGTTSGMTTLAQAIALTTGDRMLTTEQEHEGGMVGWSQLQRRRGVAIDVVPIGWEEQDSAAIVRRFEAAIRPETRVISVSHVITSTGFRMPVAEIAALARRHNALCIVDGAQAVGAIAVDVKALGCHAYATSGHKWLMGPKGTGLLYISRDASAAIEPVQWEMERRRNRDRWESARPHSFLGSAQLLTCFGSVVRRQSNGASSTCETIAGASWRAFPACAWSARRRASGRAALPPPLSLNASIAASCATVCSCATAS